MYRKASLLRGIAIVAVVLAHSFGRTYIPSGLLNNVYEQSDLLLFFQLRLPFIVVQLCHFAVPALLLITGMFMTYAVRGQSVTSDWKVVWGRIKIMLTALLFWSFIGVARHMIHNRGLPSASYWEQVLLKGEVIPGYYFIPLLIQFYVLSVFIVPLAARRPKLILSISVALQVLSLLIHEVGGLWLNVWSDIPGLGSYYGLWLFTRWSIYFVIGVVVGTRTSKVEAWLKKRRWMLALSTVLFGFLCVSQYIIFKIQINMTDQHLILVNLYAISAIGFFFSLDIKPSRLKIVLEKLGAISLPIYLIHPLIINEMFSRIIKYTNLHSNHNLIITAPIWFFIGLLVPWGTVLVVKARWFPFKIMGRKILGL